ncbi:MAG: 50S ribosomal protein L19 [Deltaproteobacteria bacterium]
MNDKIKLIESEYMKKTYPAFNVGDTVKVFTKIIEGDKVRLHPFEGLIIAERGRGIAKTFTVRKVSYGEGIERVFSLYSPEIEKIDVVRRGKVRRAKLYYLRNKVGKRATRIEAAEEPAKPAAKPAAKPEAKAEAKTEAKKTESK